MTAEVKRSDDGRSEVVCSLPDHGTIATGMDEHSAADLADRHNKTYRHLTS